MASCRRHQKQRIGVGLALCSGQRPGTAKSWASVRVHACQTHISCLSPFLRCISAVAGKERSRASYISPSLLNTHHKISIFFFSPIKFSLEIYQRSSTMIMTVTFITLHAKYTVLHAKYTLLHGKYTSYMPFTISTCQVHNSMDHNTSEVMCRLAPLSSTVSLEHYGTHREQARHQAPTDVLAGVITTNPKDLRDSPKLRDSRSKGEGIAAAVARTQGRGHRAKPTAGMESECAGCQGSCYTRCNTRAGCCTRSTAQTVHAFMPQPHSWNKPSAQGPLIEGHPSS